ncbi:MAG: glycosyltransferase family 2 protein [Bacteroidota bacterium]
MKHISIITVNYNQPLATEELLNSILEKNSGDLPEVIVVDNGSKEDHTTSWKTAYPDFIFIRSEKNLGFAGGNNLGIKHSKGKYLFLINNDTVVTGNLMPTLSKFLDENPDYAIVCPKIRYYDEPDILQYAGFTKMNFYTARNKCVGQFETDKGQYDSVPKLTHYPHGAAMMLRKDLVDKVGLMPENYFLYYEEMDWCEMFKRAGYKCGLCMEVVIFHKESLSTGKNSVLKDFYMNRNRLLFVRRNAAPAQLAIFFLYFITILNTRYSINCLRNGEAARIATFYKALYWNLTHKAYSPISEKF